MESTNELIYVVDDDWRVRTALSRLLSANGRNVHVFSSGGNFLDSARQNVASCLILDLRMPDMNGLEVQKLVGMNSQIPVIFMSGRGDVPSAVLAMKGGAVDFLTKPLHEDALMRTVDAAFARARVFQKEAEDVAMLRALYQSLSPREQEVLPLLASGLLNRQAAAILGITEYTVQVHRGRIMRKMQADSFATLLRQVSKLQIEISRATTSDA